MLTIADVGFWEGMAMEGCAKADGVMVPLILGGPFVVLPDLVRSPI